MSGRRVQVWRVRYALALRIHLGPGPFNHPILPPAELSVVQRLEAGWDGGGAGGARAPLQGSAGGAGGAVAAGAGVVQLQNANGVILQLSGPKVGAEVSAAVGGVTMRLK